MHSKIFRPSFGVASAFVVSLTSASLDPAIHAEEPYVLWAKSSGWGYDVGSGFALTPQGEALVSTFGGTLGDLRLLKFDSAGRLASSNRVSTLPGELAAINGIATDRAGNTFLAGLGGSDSNAFSVVKWDANGKVAWASRETSPLPGFSYNIANAITPDALGNLWVAGVSRGPITLGSYTFGEGSGPMLCKLDPNGRVVFARRIEHQPSRGTPDSDCKEVIVDLAGNVLISGHLGPGTADFGGTTVSLGEMQAEPWGDNFIAKYDSNGTLLWVHPAGVTDERGGFTSMSIAADRQGNVYFLESGLRLGKLNSDGALLWEKKFVDTVLSGPHGIAVDASGQAVFTGSFEGTVSFDDIVLVSKARESGTDFFVAKADPSGRILWAMRGGGGLYAEGHGVLLDDANNIFLSVNITRAAVTFDGITLLPRSDNAGYGTAAVAKLSERPSLRNAISSGSTTVTYPAKATNYVLESSVSLPAVSWNQVTNAASVSGREKQVQLPVEENARFFRLRHR